MAEPEEALREGLQNLNLGLEGARAENQTTDDLHAIEDSVVALVQAGGAGAIAVAASLLFRSTTPPSLLDWIRVSQQVPGLQGVVAIAKARALAFDIIFEFTRCAGVRNLREHAFQIITRCVETARREYYGDAKVCALRPLLLLLRADAGAAVSASRHDVPRERGEQHDEDDVALHAAEAMYGVGARNVAQALKQDFTLNKTGNKTSSASVKEKLLSVLGVLLRFHSNAVGEPLVREIARIAAHRLLNVKWTSSKYIAGTLKCLDGALSTPWGREQLLEAPAGVVDRAKLYEAIFVRAAVRQGHLYDVVSAALALIARHAPLFDDELRAEAERAPGEGGHVALIARIAFRDGAAARAVKRDVQGAALRAIEAVCALFNRAALAALGTAAEATYAARLDALVTRFTGVFRHADLARRPGERGEAAKSAELHVAICGIGNLAPAVAALIGRAGSAGSAADAERSRGVLRSMLRWLLDSARESMGGFNRTRALAMTLGAASAIVWELRVAAAAARCNATVVVGITDGELVELSAVSQHLAWSFASVSATLRGRPAVRRNAQIPVARALRRFLACMTPLSSPPRADGAAAAAAAAPAAGSDHTAAAAAPERTGCKLLSGAASDRSADRNEVRRALSTVTFPRILLTV
jgi:hypothetical protein